MHVAAVDPSKPLRVVVVFHGYHNCLRSFVGVGEPCRQFHSPRTGYSLADQLAKARLSAVVIVPQLAFDASSSDAMRLAERGALRELVTEALSEHLPFGARTLDDVSDVTFVAASGGSQALIPALAVGEVPRVKAVVSMDAYYASTPPLDGFALDAPEAFAAGRRLFVVYSEPSATLAPTLGFQARIAAKFVARGRAHDVRHVAAKHTVSTDDFAAPISFVRSDLGHDDVMRFDLWKALSALG